METTKRTSIFHILPFFLVVFFNIYSFQLPITLMVDLAVCLFLLPTARSTCYGNKTIQYIIVSGILLGVYTLIICFINGSNSLYALGKPFRFILILIIFSFLSTRFARYSTKEIIIGLVLALLIHLSFVYLEFFIPSVKDVVLPYLDTEKEEIINLPLRAFGLCSSFDGAGLVLCVLQALLWMLSLQKKSALLFVLCLLSYVGCFLVSRTSMLVSTLFMVLIIISFVKNNKKFLILFVVPVLTIGGFYVYDLATDILSDNVIEQSYRMESSEKLTGDMLYLPNSFFGMLFGTGDRSELSDIGYVNQIFMVGIVGLLWIMSIYYQTYLAVREMRFQYKYESYFLIIMLLLLLAFNYKLSFLYSRSVSDVYFLLTFTMLRKSPVAKLITKK